MPKRARELTAVQVKRLTRPGFYSVGGVVGLALQVQHETARSWVLRVKVGDRRRDFGLGPYPSVTLEQARERAREMREQLWRGVDPVAARREAANALRAAEAKRITFDEAARKCWKSKSREFRNAKHAAQWLSTLTEYASPIIGTLPVADVELAHVVKVLEPIWETKTETASRLRGRIESVLAWAKVSGYRAGDNPARWKGNLDHVLPRPTKVRRKQHHPALPWQRVPEFMTELRKVGGMGARALEFAILAAARSGEVRLATWDEIDLEEKVWAVPGERMKGGNVHRVPLSDAAVRLLESLPRFKGVPYVFAAPRGGALSDMSISAVCRRMHEVSVEGSGPGYLDPKLGRVVVPHGFRASFKTWCQESTRYQDEVSELALAHVNSDATRAAYARGELLPQRTRLMREWAKFCGSPPRKASVTPIRGRR